MTEADELAWKSAVELKEMLRWREISALEILAALRQRYESINPHINAFALPLFEHAHAAAVEADRSLAKGTDPPLCGVPVSVKDSQWLAGYPCMNGSRLLQGFVPRQTCAAIERLERAGAVVFGKTTCPEFSLTGITASDAYGVTNNPWRLDRTPGGSSGGAGAAVAAGLGPLSLGGDGGGSIRIPSAFCGLAGFKPTFGAVPREPCFPSWKTLVAYGPMARSVGDVRLMFDTLAGYQPGDRHSMALPQSRAVENLDGVRIVASEDLGHAPMEQGVLNSFHATLQRLEAAGVEIVYDDPGLSSSVRTWAITAMADAWASGRDHYDQRFNELMEVTRGVLEFGKTFTADQFLDAQYEREHIHKAYTDLFDRTGARFLVKPTLGCEAFTHGRTWPEQIAQTAIELPWLDWAGLLYDANLTGHPALALPMGFGDEGLPVSMQIAGPHGSDRELLQTAELIEQALEWPGHYPELSQLDLAGTSLPKAELPTATN